MVAAGTYHYLGAILHSEVERVEKWVGIAVILKTRQKGLQNNSGPMLILL